MLESESVESESTESESTESVSVESESTRSEAALLVIKPTRLVRTGTVAIQSKDESSMSPKTVGTTRVSSFRTLTSFPLFWVIWRVTNSRCVLLRPNKGSGAEPCCDVSSSLRTSFWSSCSGSLRGLMQQSIAGLSTLSIVESRNLRHRELTSGVMTQPCRVSLSSWAGAFGTGGDGCRGCVNFEEPGGELSLRSRVMKGPDGERCESESVRGRVSVGVSGGLFPFSCGFVISPNGATLSV